MTVVGTTNLNGKVNFNKNDNSTSTTTGAVIVDGGVGIGKSMHIGGTLVGNNVNFNAGEFGGVPDIVGFGSITANKFYGDGAGLTNTGAQLSSATTGTERVVLTNLTSGTMVTAKTDPQLTFNFATNTLSSTAFAGNLTGDVTGDVTGDLTGNADTATLASNVVGTGGRILFNNANNTTTTSINLLYNDPHLTVNGDIITKNFLYLNGTATNSGDIHTNGGDDGLAVIQNDTNSGKIRIAGKGSQGAVTTIASFDVDGTNTPVVRCSGDIIAFASSDINLKENITVIPNALDKINSLSGNTFNWKSGSSYATTPEFYSGITQDTGVIAQEVEALGLPGITTTRDDGTKAVRYERLIPILIQAVKELSAKVTALEGS